MKLKLVGLATYAGKHAGTRVLNTGDELEVSDDVGEALLGLYAVDAANGQHPYFELVGADDAPRASARRVQRARPAPRAAA